MSDLKNQIYKLPSDRENLPQLMYVGYVGIIGALFAIQSSYKLSLLLMVLSVVLVLLFGSKKFKVDLKNSTVSLGSEKFEFESIDSLIIRSKSISQRLNSRGSSTLVRYTLYSGFIGTSGQELLIGESKNRTKLYKKMDLISKDTNVSLLDEG